MRVVITVDEFHPHRWYLEHYLARELTRLGHEAHIFTFKSGNDIRNGSIDFSFTVHRLPAIAAFKPYHLPSPRATAHIVDFVRRKKPDIIHCQPVFSPLALAFLGCRAIGGHQVVGSLISGQYTIKSTVSALKYSLTKGVTERYVVQRVKYIFAKSEGLREVLLRLFDLPSEKLRVVPLGADPEVFRNDVTIRNETRAKLGIALDDVVVISSGKLSPSKRIDDLIRAIAPIMNENQKVKLLIRGVGERSYLGALKALCTHLGISKSISFHPWAARAEIPAFFNAGDIAVWPSGTSISMVEAASTGLPLISMRSPIEEYALSNDNGFTFEPGNIIELRRLLRILITDRGLRAQMGHRSRLLVEEKLNWRAIAREYLGHYTKALE